MGHHGRVTSTTRTAPESLDAHLLDLARSALDDELGPGEEPGELLGAQQEDDVAVSVGFAATTPGYSGWVWTVTLAVVEPGHATVSEVALLPGPDALLPPAWVPWAERIRPGDLGPGDLLPPVEDDPRLVPAYVQSDDPAVEDLAVELGLGRVKVMSREGRVDLAERLHDGDFGPGSPMALAAPGSCVTCGFYLPLAGSLGLVSGVCGNEWATADSRLVDAGYGCGAHSDVVVEQFPLAAQTEIAIDELRLEVHPRPPAVDLEVEADAEAVVEAVDEVAGVEDLVDSELADAPESDSAEAGSDAAGVATDDGVEAVDAVEGPAAEVDPVRADSDQDGDSTDNG